MQTIYLLNPQSEIFNTFLDADQLFSFCQRCSRFLAGRILVVSKGETARVFTLARQTPVEIQQIANDMIRNLG